MQEVILLYKTFRSISLCLCRELPIVMLSSGQQTNYIITCTFVQITMTTTIVVAVITAIYIAC